VQHVLEDVSDALLLCVDEAGARSTTVPAIHTDDLTSPADKYFCAVSSDLSMARRSFRQRRPTAARRHEDGNKATTFRPILHGPHPESLPSRKVCELRTETTGSDAVQA
jgi:hypothetical protein